MSFNASLPPLSGNPCLVSVYVDQTYANWIVNGGIENEWDSYLQKLDQMHLQEYIDIYETAYERYQNS